ncbi:hypothetical protein [Oleiphilus sp. HI0125]|uniref:hypothetical protein n=1 Tax=Oleiphilus sp. HI0125 TaxID=1822266 RepID=UPI0012E78F9F|nr:hypothetical protein [Oleiphilus sp. HI0125]
MRSYKITTIEKTSHDTTEGITMNFHFSISWVALAILLSAALVGSVHADESGNVTKHKKIEVDLNVNKEDPDTSLKRMEIIEKALSSDLIQKKRSLVKTIENDYNQKIIELLNATVSPLTKHRVITHIEVNFFSPEFETEVRASSKVAVSIILKKATFGNWQNQNGSKETAIEVLKQIISQTFNIQEDRITIVVVG